MQQLTETLSTLAKDTLGGLTSIPKQLSSKYFYDEAGSKIFQDIMRMPEYYLTNAEYEIFYRQAYPIINTMAGNSESLELIELGAGDGVKTKLLIKELSRQQIKFRYIPVDISEEILLKMTANMQSEFRGLDVYPKAGDYFDMMEEIELLSDTPKVILFLGSNIGNFTIEESIAFLKHIRSIIRTHDRLIIGFDLKKDPQTVLAAYNDAAGHTKRFNLNLLTRLNKELGANFNLDKFDHTPLYDPLKGVAESYIVSKEQQEVYFKLLDTTIHFKQWEAIYTERSQKYDEELINSIAREAGFEVVKNFTDSKFYFVDSFWKPIN
jgi:dimethylhistidine N-methyltransferase